jgi:hypothetical protein
MSDTVDEADDWPDDTGAPRVPPAPSVTPGSAPAPPPGAPHPTWSRRGCLVAGAVTGVLALVALAVVVVVLVAARGWFGDKVDDLARKRQEVVTETGIETGSTDLTHPPQRDIRLGTCEFDAEDGVQASGTLTNWTDATSDYRISLSFRAPSGADGTQGAEFGATVVTVEGVDAHATTNWSASVPVRPDGSYTCRIVRIDRWSSGQAPPSDTGS